ncbi:glycosyltransferase [Alteromonas genovensis]|uniref:glycosyltransferase n=1 Tax=Alteromonas genovensis TaxID=471225 RepID=UPI002FE0E098
MKVMHVTYDMRIGGTEMVIKNLIEGNTDANIDMSIYCIEAPLGPWGEELAQSGISITTQERKPGFDTSLIKTLRQHIIENNIDILHCHQYTPWVYGVLAAAFTKTKVIFTEHGRFYPDSSSWKRTIVNPLLALITNQITSISEATKQALVTFENLPSSRIKVIYNGITPLSIETEAVANIKRGLDLENASVIFGTVARLDPIKNQIMMINAFSKVLKALPDAKLLIVGDGEMWEHLHERVESLGISDSIIFTGYIAKPANYIGAIDIFLLSSLSEGTSMTLLEAMSLGKPCVVTDAGGNSEVIKHDSTGYVVENDNSQEFANAMLSLATQHHVYERFSTASVDRWVKEFSCDVMNKRMLQVYNDEN